MAEQTISDNGADESQEEETTKPEQVFGKLRPKGTGPGTSSAARKRHSKNLRNAVSIH